MIENKHTCAMCGRATTAHDRDVRFQLPDPVLNSPEQHRAGDSWLSDPDPNQATLMQIPYISPFVRALLPVKLEGGHELRFGVWIAIHPEDLQNACRVWNAPEYSDLKLTGYLANKIEPWGLYKVPVNLAVLNPDHTPYCVSSSDQELNDVLTLEWPHDILASPP
ncbi:DUF2199 domain-containing protein [Arthrobacter sp. OV608]|uniref:DUF2199 domain-containing protein n=1 Tax=Arthrobacter sp. OV608 TaxID=1882768 RepID=UPI0008D5B54D|nr:DUF2199 domain-containing protein [Arthrobacter sp. OV608]SEQ27515.1 hypothetical protein SAMN05444745_10551 [Arthrobacter sp. OV608]